MNATMTSTDYKDAVLAFHPEKKSGEPSWLQDLRQKARYQFDKAGFPNRKWEAWRYSHLEPILNAKFASPDPSLTPKGCFAESYRDDSGRLKSLEIPSSYRIVFVNGVFSQELSKLESNEAAIFQPLSLVLSQRPELAESFIGREVESEANPFALINAFSFQDGIFLKVAKGKPAAKPFHLLFVNTQSTLTAVTPKIVIILEEGAAAEVVSEQISFDGAAVFNNAAAEIFLAPHSRLDSLHLNRTTAGVHSFLSEKCYLQKEAVLNRIAVIQGGQSTRDEVTVEFQEEGGECMLEGLSVLGKDSQAFFHANVHHKVPRCKSNQIYKNILAGRSQVEYNSLVHVWRGAEKSVSQQQDRNLLLSDGARAYSRPQLKIDADDVQCNHGAATGQVDENELFYLRSRGLNEQLARYVMTEGFAREIVENVRPAGLKERLESSISNEIKQLLNKGGM